MLIEKFNKVTKPYSKQRKDKKTPIIIWNEAWQWNKSKQMLRTLRHLFIEIICCHVVISSQERGLASMNLHLL